MSGALGCRGLFSADKPLVIGIGTSAGEQFAEDPFNRVFDGTQQMNLAVFVAAPTATATFCAYQHIAAERPAEDERLVGRLLRSVVRVSEGGNRCQLFAACQAASISKV